MSKIKWPLHVKFFFHSEDQLSLNELTLMYLLLGV